jgi:hypothetical protein
MAQPLFRSREEFWRQERDDLRSKLRFALVVVPTLTIAGATLEMLGVPAWVTFGVLCLLFLPMTMVWYAVHLVETIVLRSAQIAREVAEAERLRLAAELERLRVQGRHLQATHLQAAPGEWKRAEADAFISWMTASLEMGERVVASTAREPLRWDPPAPETLRGFDAFAASIAEHAPEVAWTVFATRHVDRARGRAPREVHAS